MRLKLLVARIFITCIYLPFTGVFVWLMMNKHYTIAVIWILAGAAVIVAIEFAFKAIKRKLNGRK